MNAKQIERAFFVGVEETLMKRGSNSVGSQLSNLDLEPLISKRIHLINSRFDWNFALNRKVLDPIAGLF